MVAQFQFTSHADQKSKLHRQNASPCANPWLRPYWLTRKFILASCWQLTLLSFPLWIYLLKQGFLNSSSHLWIIIKTDNQRQINNCTMNFIRCWCEIVECIASIKKKHLNVLNSKLEFLEFFFEKFDKILPTWLRDFLLS